MTAGPRRASADLGSSACSREARGARHLAYADHASCEDYRAAATIDLEHDAADAHQHIACPVLALWGNQGVVNRLFKPLDDWGTVANDVRGEALRSGHFLPEGTPEETQAQLLAFFE